MNLYAMDTYFVHEMRSYPIQTQLEISQHIGFDSSYLTLFCEEDRKKISDLYRVSADLDMPVAGVYLNVDLMIPFEELRNNLLSLFDQLQPGTRLELSLGTWNSLPEPSSELGFTLSRKLLSAVVEEADARDIILCLYPHIIIWGQRHDDLLKLCKEFDHPRIRMNFCGFHWYAAHDHKDLQPLFQEMIPYLENINLCGTSKEGPVNGWKIQSLGEGEMDNFAVLSLIIENGFKGNLGFQGYSIGGDPIRSLRHSMSAFKEMQACLKDHPHWGKVNWPT